jgi:hypothetical protein
MMDHGFRPRPTQLITQEIRLPTWDQPYFQTRPMRYEGQRWPEEPGHTHLSLRDYPVHDQRTLRIYEEPGMSTEEKVAIGIGFTVGLTLTGLAIWKLVL